MKCIKKRYTFLFFIVTLLVFARIVGISWAIVLTLFLFTSQEVIKTKKKGYFWIDKKGRKLTFRQFLRRWRSGVEGITPLQQSKTSLMGIWITMTGIISGIVVNALVRMENIWWWVEIILIGSLVLTTVQFISILQKYYIHKKVEETMRQIK